MARFYAKQTNNKGAAALAAVIFLFVGVIFLIVGLVMNKINNDKEKLCTEKTYAIVIDLAESQSKDSNGRYSTTYAPVLSYEANGIEYNQVNNIYTNPCKYNIGEQVTIHYAPENPKSFYIDGDNSSKIFFYIFMAIGGLFTVIPLIIIIILIIVFRKIGKKSNNVQDQFNNGQDSVFNNVNYQSCYIPKSGGYQQNNPNAQYNNNQQQNTNYYDENKSNY